MWRRPSDTPFERDSASTFLPWIVAVMIYLSALSVTGAFLLHGAIDSWGRGLTGTLTVQVPNEVGGEPVAEEQIEQIAALLRGTAGIVRVRVLSREETAGMLRPWLGEAAQESDLPLPRLVDVGLAPGANVDVADLQERVAGVVAGASVEDHERWLRQLVDIAGASFGLSIAVVGLILLATILTIVFAARTGLKIHARVTEVLHLIGAPDSYIARQFERQAFWLGFKGAVVGTILAAGTVYLLGRFTGGVEAFGIASLSLQVWQWALFAVFPPAAAVIARITARITVLRTLGRLA